MNRIDEIIKLLDSYGITPDEHTLEVWMDDIADLYISDDVFEKTMRAIRQNEARFYQNSLPAWVAKYSLSYQKEENLAREEAREKEKKKELPDPFGDEFTGHSQLAKESRAVYEYGKEHGFDSEKYREKMELYLKWCKRIGAWDDQCEVMAVNSGYSI